jgi:hypothetical protein
MKKLCLIAGMVVAAWATTAQAGLTVTVTAGSPVQGWNNGGPFTAATNFKGTFQTFCIEKNEFLSLGGTYDVALNSAAVGGGVGGGSPDPLSKGAAWLYSYYSRGILANFANTQADVSDLQIALWMFEQELTAADGLYDLNNKYYKAAIAAGQTGASAPVGYLGVQVMNLTENGAAKQDLLVVPEPSTVIAGALLLLPFGASAVRILRRKQ